MAHGNCFLQLNGIPTLNLDLNRTEIAMRTTISGVEPKNVEGPTNFESGIARG